MPSKPFFSVDIVLLLYVFRVFFKRHSQFFSDCYLGLGESDPFTTAPSFGGA